MNSNRTKIEEELWNEGFKRIMGLDEVGRGCLCGPVVAAGVIFEEGIKIDGIKDSKAINEKNRLLLEEEIKEKALFYTIQEGSIKEIFDLNILWASINTMQKCAEAEGANPDYLLVDGNKYTTSLIPHTCIIKGDDKSLSIGAASILAKNYRDRYMKRLDGKFPEFDWKSNVGYPTPHHKKALKQFGYTPHHRLGFKLGTDKKYQKI
ncbi:MAG: ribonuclease HII [Balneola sp.]|nr:ribonuclease HII [Balneola sp.]MBO6651389.1 ribonuclease HII [Balneola sp.]MBO6710984.1 ribonuclease HII [Balneola sp.]MBO6801500.1 ribonuclease HII [Balneola sp.]MBO6870404.1 ribonuclease HII [Balneola sp.]